MRKALVLALLALTGCACNRHPVACAIGAVALAGTVSACTNHHSNSEIPTPRVNCNGGVSCQ